MAQALLVHVTTPEQIQAFAQFCEMFLGSIFMHLGELVVHIFVGIALLMLLRFAFREVSNAIDWARMKRGDR